MKALLRPLFVGGLSIAIAATTLLGSSSVALAATRPSITTWSLNGDVYEGDRPFVNATFTDGIDTGPYTVDIDWGDGYPDQYVLADLAARSFSVQKTVPYLDDSPLAYRIQISLSDPIFTTARFLTATVLNRVPSITRFALSSTDMEAGQAVGATGAFTDGAADTHTVTLDWGDGSPTTTMNLVAAVFTFGTDSTNAHSYTGAGDFTVTATVTDNAGAFGTATSSVSVHAPNQAPSVASFGVTAGSEGGSSSLSLTFADVDASDTHTVSVAWGDGLTSDSGVLSSDVTTFDASHVYADTGTYSVVLTLADSARHTVTASASVSPTNVAPAVGSLSLSPSPLVDHQTLTVSGNFTDPGTADTFTLTVDWGDLTSSTDSLPAGTRSFSATHAYTAAGPVTIKATVADRDNDRSSSSVDLVVGSSNHAPADLSLTASGDGANVVVDATFTDADVLDAHTVVMSWGDGASARQDLPANTTTFTASHVYAASNTYTVSATVSDAGTSTSATTQVVVTVPSSSAADVLDDMSGLVRSFDLDRNTERWLLRKLDDVKGSLAYGNSQVCSSSGTLSHVMAFAQRTLASDEYAALSALSTNVQAAASCSGSGAQSPKVLKASTVTPKTTVPTVTTTTAAPAPAPKKDTTPKSTKADLKASGGHSPH